ncbi:MAG TPA: hydrogenase maturation protease [Terriglobales bacterium]|jgi:hydrogenase maturation protease|nr:hydrogenase maturation protease [Terriglobales bacterium]
MNGRILIAGIGNIFLGDDAFGVEVIRVLASRALPEGVVAKDFGIRSFDLAYALLDPWEAIIFVDALPRGEAPGTLYTMEIDLKELGSSGETPDGHSMNPVKVLQLAKCSGEVRAQIFVVGCEPEDLGGDEGRMELSASVRAVVSEGALMAEELSARLLADKTLSVSNY